MSTQLHQPRDVKVTFEFSRHLGPRFIQGGVTLRFASSASFVFLSLAKWPNDNLDTAVREAIEEVLIKKIGTIDTTKVILEAIVWDPINSSESGFRKAARAATIAAFDV
jgi:hypothetical protein